METKGKWKWDDEKGELVLLPPDGPKVAKEVKEPVIYTGQYL